MYLYCVAVTHRLYMFSRRSNIILSCAYGRSDGDVINNNWSLDRIMSDQAYRTKSANELVEIVDVNNNVLLPALRCEMRKHKLIHRATYAFIRNSDNYYYVQKRSHLKDYCPSYFDPTPGGVVSAGETYEDTNLREVEEEMGIKSTQATHLFTFYYEDERVRCFGDAWDMVYDGPLKLQEEEVESVHMMSMRDILQRADSGEDFTPDSIFACRKYVELFGYRDVVI